MLKRSYSRITFTLFLLIISLTSYLVNAQEPKPFWPEQKAPTSIVICKINNFDNLAEMNLAQSISGLAAQSINSNKNSEGVWIENRNIAYQSYYASLVKRLKLKGNGSFDVWQLVDRFKEKGVIRGYILYDVQRGDNSINLATVYCSIKNGVLIDRTQENDAIHHGLIKLQDLSKDSLDPKSFNLLAPQLSPNLLVVANPKFSNNRDFAIAHRCMIYYGVDSLFLTILNWVKPLSPVIGWNKGDEFKQIEPCTSRALINVPADWCMNLALLAITPKEAPRKVNSLDPKSIDWSKSGDFNSFVMSDGDNIQWAFSSFLDSGDYWKNQFNSEIPMSFTSCVFNLSEAGRDVYNQLVQSQSKQVSIVEYGGGYYYPDLFGRMTGAPEQLLREHAKRINKELKRTGTKVFGFICRNVSSPDAIKAYQIFAEELDDITGMIAAQYSPYNGGNGAIYWLKNKKGIEVPVVAAKYQLWANQNIVNSGNPQKLSEQINKNNEKAGDQLTWTIVHAWSEYASDSVDIPDNMRKAAKGFRGVTPVKWTKNLLHNNTKVVSIEELLWRLRMQHNSMDTRHIID
ncbi:hypothetical protein [Mucilaginibacter sp.]|jgi:hypothetical protein|uniref:hypothetical protein n=1 Tax=Mucilaginibacter sp. TaxID=1882438 RepID=UPI003569B955